MNDCDPRDIAIKSFFLGPQSENRDWLRLKWSQILERWIDWRVTRFPQDGSAVSNADRESPAFQEALGRLDLAVSEILEDLQNETPKFTPRYIGHMVSEISLPALLGHVCALLHNPNNTSREVSRVTSRLEDEAIIGLATMMGFGASANGHFTSGGTVANYEALWRAIVRYDGRLNEETGSSLLSLGPWSFAKKYRELTGADFQGPVVLVPNNKHFSWEKAVSLMGLGDEAFWGIELSGQGRLDPADLRAKIEKARSASRAVVMVVSVAGTTELGEVDPVDKVQDILDEYRKAGEDIWHHVDAAYGGYYASMLDSGELEGKLAENVARSLRAIRHADSVTLDPHKLGYVPYACGAFVSRDQDHYSTRGFSADYLLKGNGSRWPFTLEGSRSGAGVTATWLSNKALGLNSEGYGRVLAKGIEAREAIAKRLKVEIPETLIVEPSDLNILCFSFARNGQRLSEINAETLKVFEAFEKSPWFSISKTVFHTRSYAALFQRLAGERAIFVDSEDWIQLRLVLMNPFILSKELATDFIGEFIAELQAVRKTMQRGTA